MLVGNGEREGVRGCGFGDNDGDIGAGNECSCGKCDGKGGSDNL